MDTYSHGQVQAWTSTSMEQLHVESLILQQTYKVSNAGAKSQSFLQTSCI